MFRKSNMRKIDIYSPCSESQPTRKYSNQWHHPSHKGKKTKKDWISFSKALCLDMKEVIMNFIWTNLFIGSLNSILQESIVMPRNSITVVGNTVFSCASWTPNDLQILTKQDNES